MFDFMSRLTRPREIDRPEIALSIPMMDGPLKPNNKLEEAAVIASYEDLEDLAADPLSGRLLVAHGTKISTLLPDASPSPLVELPGRISAIEVASNGDILVATGNCVHLIGHDGSRREVKVLDGLPLVAVNSIRAASDGQVIIADSSSGSPCADWVRDLMTKGRSGRLIRWDYRTDEVWTVATGLAYPFCGADCHGQVIVSESWRHRVTTVGVGTLTAHPTLPGYPARLSPAHDGGHWLSIFAARTQLVEFVLKEDDYREEMIATIEPQHWVAPAMHSGSDYLEPLQFGSIKTMGILKPWAPARSYGLVVHLSPDMVPTASFHSRVGGRNHGIVAALEWNGHLVVASKGSGNVLQVPLSVQH